MPTQTTSSLPAPSRRRLVGLAVWLLLAAHLTAAGPVAAQSHWTLRAHGAVWTQISDQVTVTRDSAAGTPESGVHSISDGSSAGVGLEYRVTPRLGIELGFLVGRLDTEFRSGTAAGTVTDSDAFDTYATTLGLLYHFRPDSPTDLYLGVFSQQLNFSDVTFQTAAGSSRKLTFDDDYGIGIKLGFDRPFRRQSSWLFSADVRYVLTLLEAEVAGEDLDVDPLILSVGVGYRF